MYTNNYFTDIDGADNNINTMEDNDWHLSATCPTSITQGGGTNTGILTLDIDLTGRTVPWSIGADER